MILHEVIKEGVKDNVGLSLKSNFPTSSVLMVLMSHIDKIGVGDGLPEDKGLVVHLPDCLMGCVVERLQQKIASIARQQQAQVLSRQWSDW